MELNLSTLELMFFESVKGIINLTLKGIINLTLLGAKFGITEEM